MKGTFFSADFAKDSNGNLRLLEINTDTSIVGNELSNFNFTEFAEILTTNDIAELHITYKPVFHNEIVSAISTAITTSIPSLADNIVLHPEDLNTIYPESIEDSDDKFILRLAYDESALFDSVYCKSTLELLSLFDSSDSTDSGSFVVSHYYSGSDSITNTLESTINPSNIPDVAIKDITEVYNPISFYKIGSTVENESNEDRWNSFVEEIKGDDKLILQYHYNTSNTDDNGHITSVRSFQIVYGSDLSVVTLHSYKISSIFELPADISSEVDTTRYINKLSDIHYYEFATNFIKAGSSGILSTHKIQMVDGTFTEIGDTEVGDFVSSYFISGSPQVESDSTLLAWNFEGNELPSGSFITSSQVVFKVERDSTYNALMEVVIDSDSKFTGTGKQWLVYNSSSNQTAYKPTQYLNPDDDYFFDLNGNIIDIDEVNFYVTSDTGLKIVELDVEDTDTYIISGSTSFQAIVSHNAPCFVAGTEITLANGEYKLVEDIKIGDSVLSFNFATNVVEPHLVKGIGSKLVNTTVKYTFEDNSIIESTLDHPLYSKEKGWVSMDPDYTTGVYNLTTTKAEEGFKVFKQDGSELTILSTEILTEPTAVYNVKTVEVNHNFFANKVLVHNRYCFIAGTSIMLSNGDEKNIEDVVVGDTVLTYNEKTGIHQDKNVLDTESPVHDDLVKYTFSNQTEVISTHDHPFYVNNLELASYAPKLTNERYDLPLEVSQIKVGDTVYTLDSDIETTILGITELPVVPTQTYIFSVEDNRNFYANGILVHNK